jgi:transaldolase
VSRLHELYREHGQSPWIDNITRDGIRGGQLQSLVDQGIRGVTSNPTIFQKAISAGDAYDEQFRELIKVHPVEDAYWGLVIQDITEALEILRPVYDEDPGADGFVSIEVSPALAADTETTTKSARFLHERIDRPNLMVKIPATPEGIPSIQRMVAEGRNINITLIFSIERYEQVIDAYLDGLEECEGDLSRVSSVASFFVSRVDTEVDRRLEAIGTEEAMSLRGKAAVAQAKLAYQLFRDRFAGPRWDALVARGARVQRPLWASTSTKNPAYPDLLYVDTLIGPDTVNTQPDATVAAFVDHGTVARTVDKGADEARDTLEHVEALGIDMGDVGTTLEAEGVAAFVKSYDELLQALQDKANGLTSS